MTLSPEIKKDPEYRKAIAWLIGGVTVFLLLAFFSRYAAVALLIGFFVGGAKYVKIRKKYLQPKSSSLA